MLYYLVATLYVLTCLVLMLVILLQQGRGGDIANAFGGSSSQAAFGARSGAPLLTKATSDGRVLVTLVASDEGHLGRRVSLHAVRAGAFDHRTARHGVSGQRHARSATGREAATA